LWAIEHQKVHAGSVHGILGSLQKPGINERINCVSDLLHVVSHEGGELLVGQKCARMPVQEHQQVEVTRPADERSEGEQALGFFEPLMIRAVQGLARFSEHGLFAACGETLKKTQAHLPIIANVNCENGK
jgi:hypothetical protein